MKKITSFFVLLAFVLSCIMPPQGFAQTLTAVGLMPQPGTPVALSSVFTPAHLRGMVIHPNDPFKFDFIIYRGDEQLNADQKQEEYPKLIKYFLAALAIPDDEQWVNLSPYEKDRIIPDGFGLTEMGRDLLAQDYLLKQLASSLTDPNSELGNKFWDGVYAEAFKRFGTTDVPTDTFNKVWIMPDKAVVFEKNSSVYVLESHLKVMTEKDYLAAKKNASGEASAEANQIADISSQIMKDVLIPAIEKEVNEGKGFAPLRQVYSGMLLATWYKRALKESILGKLYADQGKVKGVDQDPKNNEEIYQKYVQAFRKGVFNLIKEDVDRFTQELIPRKYFSGGFTRNGVQEALTYEKADVAIPKIDNAMKDEKTDIVATAMTNFGGVDALKAKDAAMTQEQVQDALMKAGVLAKPVKEAPIRDAWSAEITAEYRGQISADTARDKADAERILGEIFSDRTVTVDSVLAGGLKADGKVHYNVIFKVADAAMAKTSKTVAIAMIATLLSAGTAGILWKNFASRQQLPVLSEGFNAHVMMMKIVTKTEITSVPVSDGKEEIKLVPSEQRVEAVVTAPEETSVSREIAFPMARSSTEMISKNLALGGTEYTQKGSAYGLFFNSDDDIAVLKLLQASTTKGTGKAFAKVITETLTAIEQGQRSKMMEVSRSSDPKWERYPKALQKAVQGLLQVIVTWKENGDYTLTIIEKKKSTSDQAMSQQEMEAVIGPNQRSLSDIANELKQVGITGEEIDTFLSGYDMNGPGIHIRSEGNRIGEFNQYVVSKLSGDQAKVRAVLRAMEIVFYEKNGTGRSYEDEKKYTAALKATLGSSDAAMGFNYTEGKDQLRELFKGQEEVLKELEGLGNVDKLIGFAEKMSSTADDELKARLDKVSSGLRAFWAWDYQNRHEGGPIQFMARDKVLRAISIVPEGSAMTERQRARVRAAGIDILREETGFVSLEIKLQENEVPVMTQQKALEKFASAMGWAKEALNARPGSFKVSGTTVKIDLNIDAAMGDTLRKVLIGFTIVLGLSAAGAGAMKIPETSVDKLITLTEQFFSPFPESVDIPLSKLTNSGNSRELIKGFVKEGLLTSIEANELRAELDNKDVVIDQPQDTSLEAQAARRLRAGLGWPEGYIVVKDGDTMRLIRYNAGKKTELPEKVNIDTKGGIDFAQSSLDMQIKRDGAGVPLPVSQQNLDNIRIEGLVPVILNIQPAANVPLFSATP